MDKLTKKQKGFVKDYVETGNGTQSALKNYDTDDYSTAGAIASENLNKPKVKDAIDSIAERITVDVLVKNHLKLFEQKRIDYFVFPKYMKDDEIIEHVEAQGLIVLSVREGDKGKMAFYALPDAQAIRAGVDMGYKLKGSYAPDKRITLTLNTQTPEQLAKAKEFDEWLKKQQTA